MQWIITHLKLRKCPKKWVFAAISCICSLLSVILMLKLIFEPCIQISAERKRVASDPKSIMPAAFVSFKTRWGAAVCAQTQQSRNPTLWLTDWAPEPRDVYWPNLAIPYVSLTIRRLIMGVAFFFLTFFFMIPITIVQSLASIEGIEKVVPFIRHLIEMWVLLLHLISWITYLYGVYTWKWTCYLIELARQRCSPGKRPDLLMNPQNWLGLFSWPDNHTLLPVVCQN